MSGVSKIGIACRAVPMSSLTKSTGLDTRTEFAVAPLPESPLTFLLVGRLLEAKEDCVNMQEAARLV